MYDLLEISEQLSQIWNEIKEDSDVYGSVVTVQDHKMYMYQLFAQLENELEEVSKTEKNQFLAVPLIEKFLDTIKPYYKVSILDVLSGKAQKKAEHLMDFISRLKNSEVYEKWETVNRNIQNMMQTLSLPNNIYETGQLQHVYDAVKDALTFLEKNKAITVCSGNISKDTCKIVPYISIHSSIYEFIKIMKDSPNAAFVTFGAIRSTYGDKENKLEAFLQNQSGDERVRNFAKNSNTTVEEIRKREDVCNNQIVIGIKNGENIWMISSVVNRLCGYYIDSLDYGDFFSCGKRVTYLPLQVFFEDMPAPANDVTELAVKRTGYWIKDLIDSHQSVWLISVLSEIKNEFFADNRETLEESVVFEQETDIVIARAEEKMALSSNTLPSVYREQVLIDIDALCTTPKAKELIDFLQISPKDFVGIPIWNNFPYLEKHSAKATLKHNASLVLAKIAADRLSIQMKSYLKGNLTEIQERLKSREQEILKMVAEKNPQILRCTTIYEQKKTDCYLDGVSLGGLSYDNFAYSYKYNKKKTYFFYPETLKGRKPPVVVQINPVTAAEIQCVLGYTKETFPEILNFFFLFADVDEKQKDIFENTFFHKKIKNTISTNEKSMFDLLKVQLCFGKREYKKMIL